MTTRLILAALLGFALGAAGQSPAPKKKKDDVPAGYRKLVLEGFTLYYSDQVHQEDRASKLKRAPLEALETELQLVSAAFKNLPADKLKKIKSVPIWVEWDEKLALGNGRVGGAVAVFLGGHQAGLMPRGDDPVKANAVTILSLRSLAAEHQPGTDSGRCVTLHELAHAFHFHVVGIDNPQVRETYRQAMERKLYDPALYVATNEHEYFAELSCCYLKKLDYFPRTRDELKKHDPKGYELMHKVWGRAPDDKGPVAAAAGPKLASPDGDGQFPLTGTTADIRPGRALVGTLPDKAEWAGRPVVGVQFPLRDGRALAAVTRLSALASDLEDFGLVAFGVETGGAGPDEMEKVARLRGITVPLLSETRFGIPGTYRLPHAYVYDHAGRCVFRGNPLDAEGYVKVAVGKAVLARVQADLTDKASKPVADLLAQGAPMPQVLAKLADQMRVAPRDGAAGLKELQAALTAGAQKVLDAAKEKEKTDPVGAYVDAHRLATTYRGTPVEKPATALISRLVGNPKVEREARARAALAGLKKLEAQLAGKDLSFDPRLPAFKEDNAALLKQFADAVGKLRKSYAGTRAADEAARLAERWDVAVK